MRHYPSNSPKAAARLLGLAVLADGNMSNTELDTLDRLRAYTQLGLGRVELHTVIHELCEDMLANMQLTWEDACRVDTDTLARLLREIDDPALQRRLTRICIAVIEADAHVSEGESSLLGAAVEQWGLHSEMFEPRADRYEPVERAARDERLAA
jgi:uncharacterized tellurite resistance protein B-like protein